MINIRLGCVLPKVTQEGRLFSENEPIYRQCPVSERKYREMEFLIGTGLESTEESSEKQKKLLKAVKEFDRYISVNQSSIPNYGDRYRHGETISTAFVE